MTLIESSFQKRILGSIVLVLMAFICYFPNQSFSSAPPKRQPADIDQVLQRSWSFYKEQFMPNGERVESNNYGGTITEGQSYALMKAVWMNDPVTFDKVWNWTRKNMRRPHDHLFGWRWGKLSNGNYGLIETHNASDADQDIAYALLLAGEQWKRPDYIQGAQQIITDLWRHNVHEINDRYYISPGTWEGFHQADGLTLDPSYFAPYVYRKFAQYDKAHAQGWLALADNIYDTLEQCSNLTSHKLPPNWCAVSWKDNTISFSDVQGPNARHFSYDAYRVFWRMAMDAALGSPKAMDYLKRHRHLLALWDKEHKLPEVVLPDGSVDGPKPSGFTHSAAMAQRFRVGNQSAEKVYTDMLAPYYEEDGFWFNHYNDYLHSVIWLHLYTLSLDRKKS